MGGGPHEGASAGLVRIDPRTGTKIVPLSKLPDEVIEALIACKEMINSTCWRVGAIANAVYDWAQRARGDGLRYEVDRMQIYGMVGRVIGKSGRTVRWYAETERFFQNGALRQIREEHAELPFSHFAFARRFGEDEAGAILYHAVTLMEEQGYPPSVERLEAEYGEKLAEIRAAERTGAFLSGAGRSEADAGEEGEVIDPGALLIALVDEGVRDLTGAAPPEKTGKLADIQAVLDVKSTRATVAGEVERLGRELEGALAALAGDEELKKSKRGIEREMQEVTRRVIGLGRWIRRAS